MCHLAFLLLIVQDLSNLPLPALWPSNILQSCLLGTGSESETAGDRHTLMTPIWLFFNYCIQSN